MCAIAEGRQARVELIYGERAVLGKKNVSETVDRDPCFGLRCGRRILRVTTTESVHLVERIGVHEHVERRTGVGLDQMGWRWYVTDDAGDGHFDPVVD